MCNFEKNSGAKCPYFGICGGCRLQHVPMDVQLTKKQERLVEMMGEIGSYDLLNPIDGPHWNYRYRARLAAKHVPKKGGTLVGFRERDSRFVTDMCECNILAPEISELILPLRELLDSMSVKSSVPQFEFSVGDDCLAIAMRHLKALTEKDTELLADFEKTHKVKIFLQPKGPDTVVPLESDYMPQLRYTLPEYDLDIEFGPLDFMQVNPLINKKLIAQVLKFLDPKPNEKIADLFCGLGNFSLPIARTGAKVCGFESVEGQVLKAKKNAQRNNLDMLTTFKVCDLYSSKSYENDFLGSFDKILLDPPRSGAEEVVKNIPDNGLKLIVYVSCNPETLARDAQILVCKKKYSLKFCGIVNMFPHTLHAEAIAVFERKKH